MASALHNLSSYEASSVPSAEGMSFGIVVADWNDRYTYAMAEAAIETLKAHDVNEEDILVKHVPGSFELVYGAAWMMENIEVDAIIAIGCVIRGDTPHFDYICQGVTAGIARLNATSNIPVIYGLLTTNDMQQARDRAGGRLGNKGDECAVVAIKMAKF